MIFLFATPMEAQCFRKASPHAQIEICGVGGAECAATVAQLIASMEAKGERKRLVLAGIAGSYSLSDVAMGEVVEVVEERIEALPERFGVRYRSEPLTELRGVSSNTVNSSGGDGLAKPISQIENMEGAHFVALCERMGVEHLQVRAISNKVGDPFSRWQIDEACAALSNALKRIEAK